MALLEDLDHRFVFLVGAKDGVELLLGHLAEDALVALARVVDVERWVRKVYIQSTTSARGIVVSPLRHEVYYASADKHTYRLRVDDHEELVGGHGVRLQC